jgi:hypothetical protein
MHRTSRGQKRKRNRGPRGRNQCVGQSAALTISMRASVPTHKFWNEFGIAQDGGWNKSDQIGARQGANRSQVRPRRAEQVPAALAAGCDPAAGRRAGIVARALTRLHGRIPASGAPAPRSGAHLARICNAVWRRFSSSFVPKLMGRHTRDAEAHRFPSASCACSGIACPSWVDPIRAIRASAQSRSSPHA